MRMKSGIMDIKRYKCKLAGLLLGMMLITGCGTKLDSYLEENSSVAEETVTEQMASETILSKENKTDKDAADGELEVHFIDVGQGDATLLSCNGEYMLIDAGDNDKGTAVQYYLQAKGVTELKYVVGTHPDADHVGGLDVVITKFDCQTILMTGEQRDTDTYQDVLNAMKYRGYTVTVPVPGDEFFLGDASFTIEGPLVFSEDSNDNSIVIRLEHGENRFLFSGDAGEEAEEQILSTGRDISADVYKVGHHGSRSSTSEAFLQGINPQYAVISVGEDNRYGHPTAEVLNRLRMHGVEVFRTDEQGGIIAISDGRSITWSSSPSDSWQVGEAQGNVVSIGDSDETGMESIQNTQIEDITEKIVYITETGTKYHAAGCRYLKDGIEIERNKAIAAGYEPCKTCGGDE